MQIQRREGRDEGVHLRMCARCGYMHVGYGGGGGVSVYMYVHLYVCSNPFLG